MADPERIEKLAARLATLPRVSLAQLPTPLQEAPRLTRHLGGPRIFFKRDDLTGLALGGNKARKLEHIMGDAVTGGADVVVTGGARQSNHVRMTAAAARSLGLDVVAVVYPKGPAGNTGNLLLLRQLGAEIIMTGQPDARQAEQVMREAAERLRADGRNPYVVPLGGTVALGDAGYAGCAAELAGQLDDAGIEQPHVVVATGSGGTHAGLLAGARWLGDPFTVAGVTVSRPVPAGTERVAQLATATADLLALGLAFSPADVTLHDAIGPGYAAASQAGHAAMRAVAEQEGVFLDPVYTGKAMSALIDLIRRGRFGRSDTCVFIHTGGIPATFAFAAELGAS